MKRKRFVMVVLVSLVSTLFFTTLLFAQEKIKVGFIGAMTGDSAVFGERCGEGFNMFWDEYNVKGGLKGKRIEVITDDDEGQPAKTINAANKQLIKDEILVGFATTNTNTALAVLPLFKKYGVAHVTQVFGAQVTKAGSPYVFRVAPVTDVFAHTCLKWANEKNNVKEIAIISDNGSYGQTVGDTWQQTAPLYGIKVVTRELIKLGDKDFTGQLLKIKKLNPQMIVFNIGWEMTMGLLAKNIRKVGMDTPILTGALDVPKFYEYGGEATNGTIIGLPFSGFESSEGRRDFLKRFKAKFGKDPVVHNVWGYDAANVVAIGMENAYPTVTRESIYQGIKKISGVALLQGVYDYKNTQDGIKTSEIIKLVDGKMVHVQ